jgi:hypothetical protein
VFGLIEAHRKAHAAHVASLELQNRFERRYGIGHGNWISTQPRDEFYLAAIVQNLKTMALRLLGPPTMPFRPKTGRSIPISNGSWPSAWAPGPWR